MSALSGDLGSAVPTQPGETPASAAFAFYMDWPPGKPENNG
jgi:hypothetical protein